MAFSGVSKILPSFFCFLGQLLCSGLNLTLSSAAIGPVEGKLSGVFTKLAKLNEKNKFDFAIIIGDLFADPDSATSTDNEQIGSLLRGDIVVPVATYFTVGAHTLPSSILELVESSTREVCPNLIFLGRKALVKTFEGLRIVALGGTYLETKEHEARKAGSPHYDSNEAFSLKGVNSADILVTSEWPKGICENSKGDILERNENSSQQCIASLSTALKPRYHFSFSRNKFYEREPFIQNNADSLSTGYAVTRFISLPAFENSVKEKWIYAFSIEIQPKVLSEIPLGTTQSPFQEGKKRSCPSLENFRFSANGGESRQHRKYRKHSPQGTRPCFFCLSNPDIATYLVTSIGNESYLTIAKGPLTTPETYEDLRFCAHILIIPMAHTPKLSQIPKADLRKETIREMTSYRKALQHMTEQLSNSRLGAVTWEISRATGVHVHWQFLPISADLIKRGLVDAAFIIEAENLKYPALKRENEASSEEEGEDSFRVTIWCPRKPIGEDSKTDQGTSNQSSKEYSLILPLEDNFRFDLQFGRKVLAKLLGLESRLRWQDCSESVEKETADAEAFKKAFQPFDFTA